MNKFKILYITIMVFGIYAAQAQDINEAFNFSNTSVLGTARSMGFGNALGSVGGDFSSIAVNPAGLGIYRSSEISLTPSLKVDGSSSKYLGATTSDNNTNFNFNNWGIVFTNSAKGKRYERRKWKTVSFAFGMNKTADFNRNYTYQGLNNKSSASQAFESDANLNPGNDSTPGSLGYLGYQGYLINNDTTGKFHTIVPFQGGINQQKTMQQRGGINEYDISLGGNYMEKLLLGITLGIPVVNYQFNSTYTETIAPGNNYNPDTFTSFSYRKSLNVTGSGVNLKLGAIWKVTDNFRIGVALHSPTYYSLSETFTPSLYSQVAGNSYVIDNSYANIGSQFDYNLTTPMKTVLSATYIFKAKGFISADYEYVNYNTMRFKYPTDNLTGQSFQDEENAINQDIKNTYKGASNIRVGGELLLGKGFMVRAGFGYYGNPYKSSDTLDHSVQRIDLSCGLGIHFKSFFTDLGLVHSMYEIYNQPYFIDYSGVVSSTTAVAIPQAKINYQLNNIALTIGWKF